MFPNDINDNKVVLNDMNTIPDMSKKGEEEIKVDRVSDSDSYIYSNRLYGK